MWNIPIIDSFVCLNCHEFDCISFFFNVILYFMKQITQSYKLIFVCRLWPTALRPPYPLGAQEGFFQFVFHIQICMYLFHGKRQYFYNCRFSRWKFHVFWTVDHPKLVLFKVPRYKLTKVGNIRNEELDFYRVYIKFTCVYCDFSVLNVILFVCRAWVCVGNEWNNFQKLY